MSKYIGRLLNMGVARETTRGVGVAPTYRLPYVSLSFDDKIVQARSIGSLGKLDDSEEAFVTTNYGEGEIEGEIRSKSFGLFLYGLLGSLSTSGPTDSLYTHSFTLAHNNQHTSLSLLAEDPNTTELYKLGMLSSLEITAELDQVVMFKAGFMSKKAVTSGASMAALTTEHKFTKKHVKAKVAADISSLSGATALSIKSITLTLSKNVSLDDVLGTAEPEDILNRQVSVEGEIVLNYEDETWKNYFRNGTNRALEIALVNTDATIGVSSNPSLTFQFPKVDFTQWEPNYDLDDITRQTISFKCSRDVANNQDIVHLCQLKNDVASY